MKKLIISVVLAFTLLGCAGSSSGKASSDSTSTASDTITNVTNPGVGAASDDTLKKP
ncbi:MAG: hypothetical protein JWQ09_3245 [Segetibacter sp.]|nr:hypothetical protein [Segetibacter sp.]